MPTNLKKSNQIAFSEACDNKFKLKTEIGTHIQNIGVFTETEVDLGKSLVLIGVHSSGHGAKGTPKILDNKKYGGSNKAFDEALLNSEKNNFRKIFKPKYLTVSSLQEKMVKILISIKT